MPAKKPPAKPIPANLKPAEDTPAARLKPAKTAGPSAAPTAGQVAVVAWAWLWRSWLVAITFGLVGMVAWPLLLGTHMTAFELTMGFLLLTDGQFTPAVTAFFLNMLIGFALQIYVFSWLAEDRPTGKGWHLALAAAPSRAGPFRWVKVWWSFYWRYTVGIIFLLIPYIASLTVQAPPEHAGFMATVLIIPLYVVLFLAYLLILPAAVWRSLLKKKTFGWGTLSLAK